MFRRLVQCSILACLALGHSQAAGDPFVGRWKLNPAASHLTDQMTVEARGANKYSFNLGGPATETIVVDGTDQPGFSGTTLAVTVENPHQWRVVRKKDGRTVLQATWRLSKDGRTLRDRITTLNRSGPSLTAEYLYERTAGSSGFAGTWESTNVQLNSVFELQIRPYAGDGLSFNVPSEGATKNVRFDVGRPTDHDPAHGSASSGHRVNERAIRLTDRAGGKVVDTQDLSVSRDGRTLTMTVHNAGQSRPNALVFERE